MIANLSEAKARGVAYAMTKMLNGKQAPAG
jgi:hypothetical protein